MEPNHHSPTCTGCPRCSSLALAILRNPTNPVLSEAMGNSRLRTLAEKALSTNEGFRRAEGKRNNAADRATIQGQHDLAHQLHDSTMNLGATCNGDLNADDERNADPDDQGVTRGASSYLRVAARRKPLPRRQIDTNPPNPYQAATLSAAERAEALSPDSYPNYQPHGRPADSYAIGVAMRRLEKQPGATPTPAVIRDAHGIPDPYTTALARRSA
jgi:hypothetical protein